MLQESNVILLTIQKLQKPSNWLFFGWIQLGVHLAHFWTLVDCDRVWQPGQTLKQVYICFLFYCWDLLHDIKNPNIYICQPKKRNSNIRRHVSVLPSGFMWMLNIYAPSFPIICWHWWTSSTHRTRVLTLLQQHPSPARLCIVCFLLHTHSSSPSMSPASGMASCRGPE